MNPSPRQKLKLPPIHISPVCSNPFSEVIFLLITTMYITHLLSFKSSLIPSIWLAKTYFRFQRYFMRKTVQAVILWAYFLQLHCWYSSALTHTTVGLVREPLYDTAAHQNSLLSVAVSLLLTGMWIVPMLPVTVNSTEEKTKTFDSKSRLSAIISLGWWMFSNGAQC